MIRALLYLRLTSLQNLLIARVKRLKQPKYFLGAIAGLAYFWMIFFRHLVPGAVRAKRHATPALSDVLGPAAALPVLDHTSLLIAALGALLLFGIVVFAWVVPTSKPGLRFTEAETAFLFPAPASRRMLINFKLLGAQFSILFTSLLLTLISNRWSFLGGNAFTHAIGWWVIFSTLNLHFTGAALTLTRLIDGGVSTWRRRALVLGGIGLAVAATFAWVWRDLPVPTAEEISGVNPFAHYVLTVLNRGVLGWLLWPFRLVLAPFLAADSRAFLLAIGPALLVIAAHYFWVLRMEVSFEEASLGLAEKRAAFIAKARAGHFAAFSATKKKAKPGRFPLADTGRPEIAFLWKNLLSTPGYMNLRTLGVLAAIVIVGTQWLHRGGNMSRAALGVLGGASMIGVIYTLLFGPHVARQDLRADLTHADMLKAYPVRGWQLVLGELLTPVVILTGLIWLFELTAVLSFASPRLLGKTARLGGPATLALCAAVLAPALITLQLLVLNGATLLFPAWFQNVRSPGGGGIEVMGQRLIFMLGNVIVLILALLPAAMAASAVLVVTYGYSALLNLFSAGEVQFVTVPGLLAATATVLAILLGEAWCALWWLGERFEKFDLSAELRP